MMMMKKSEKDCKILETNSKSDLRFHNYSEEFKIPFQSLTKAI